MKDQETEDLFRQIAGDDYKEQRFREAVERAIRKRKVRSLWAGIVGYVGLIVFEIGLVVVLSAIPAFVIAGLWPYFFNAAGAPVPDWPGLSQVWNAVIAFYLLLISLAVPLFIIRGQWIWISKLAESRTNQQEPPQ